MSLDANEHRKKYARPHDRWQCALDESHSCGGVGSHRPNEGECIPKPSLRLHRGIFTVSCTAMVLGLLLACWNNPKRNEFLAPGPLSNSHAQILVSEGSNRCASCHGAGDKTLITWIRDAVSSGKHIPVSQSQLCMDCHDKSLAAEFAMHAHNLPPAELAQLTADTVSTQSSFGFPDPRNATGQLACATCHREHHGAEFNLSALSDKQCQTCHVNHFHSFERDHPEFSRWPFPERTGIAFDHVSHGLKHFAGKNETFDCRQCHIDDPQGNVKLVASFDISCAKCHESNIAGDQNPQWTLFQLPMLDTDALVEAGYSVGLWPLSCTGDFDGDLPPAMRLLLMSDVRTAAIFERHNNNFRFADLDPKNPDDLLDAATLAWSIKELLFGLTVNGNREIRQRLNDSLELELDSSQLKAVTYGLHDAVFAQTQQAWMPGLLAEMTSRNAELNGFHYDGEPNRVFGRPQSMDEETLAVNPLAQIYQQKHPETELSAPASPVISIPEESSTQSTQIVTVPPAEPDLPGSDRHRVRNSHVDDQVLAGTRAFSGSDDVLAKNPLSGLQSGQGLHVPRPPTQNPGSDKTGQAIREAIKKLAPHGSGGWYRNDNDFSISYRVSNHIDPLLMSWTDLAISHHSNRAVEDSGLFEALNSPLAAGQCRSCHTAEQSEDGRLHVNWSPGYRDVSVRGFTRFSHRSHDIQTTLQDCNSCHQLDETRPNAEFFAGFDATFFRSNFAPVSKSNCASCHRAGGAPSGCVDCHNYHVGSKVSSGN